MSCRVLVKEKSLDGRAGDEAAVKWKGSGGVLRMVVSKRELVVQVRSVIIRWREQNKGRSLVAIGLKRGRKLREGQQPQSTFSPAQQSRVSRMIQCLYYFSKSCVKRAIVVLGTSLMLHVQRSSSEG